MIIICLISEQIHPIIISHILVPVTNDGNIDEVNLHFRGFGIVICIVVDKDITLGSCHDIVQSIMQRIGAGTFTRIPVLNLQPYGIIFDTTNSYKV